MWALSSSGNCKQSSNETISSSRDDISSSVLVTEFFSGNFQSTRKPFGLNGFADLNGFPLTLVTYLL